MNESLWWAFALGAASTALVAQLAPWTLPAIGIVAAVVVLGLQARAWWSRRG